jgi:hypothetical protein
MFLQDFNYEVKYRPGRCNSNADALSRCATVANNVQGDDDFAKLLKDEPIPPESEYYQVRGDIIKEGEALWIRIGNLHRKVIPRHRREEILSEVHQFGHFGIKKTFHLLETIFC